MKEKMIEHFEAEINRATYQLEHHKADKYTTAYSIIDRAISRCYGVAEFCLQFMDYDEVNSIYENYKKKLENLLTNG
jgi:hypothetical protein